MVDGSFEIYFDLPEFVYFFSRKLFVATIGHLHKNVATDEMKLKKNCYIQYFSCLYDRSVYFGVGTIVTGAPSTAKPATVCTYWQMILDNEVNNPGVLKTTHYIVFKPIFFL